MPALGPAFDACLLATGGSNHALLSAAAARDAATLLRSLPDVFRCAGVECRLQEGKPLVDVVACAERRRAAPLLAAASGSYCGALLQAWLDGRDPTASNMSAVWLEFDRLPCPEADALQRSPWLDAFAFFRVAEAAARLPARGNATALFAALGSHFTGMPAAAGRALSEALPRGASLLHLAALRHRGDHELRAHVAVAAQELGEYLAVVLAHDSAKQRLIRHIIGNFCGPLALQLAMTTAGFRPKSVELSLPHDDHGKAAWEEIFSRLVETSLAAAPKARAVQAWVGTTDHQPEGAPAVVRTDRTFHVTLRLDQQPAAKAYLYFYPRYVADRKSMPCSGPN